MGGERVAGAGASGRESIPHLHPAAGCHFAVDGRNPPRGLRRLSRASCFRTPASRLSDDSGLDVLSRRESRRDDLLRHRADGASVRTNPRTAADELHQLLRRIDDHAAVRSEAGHRRRRAGSAGGDQRRGEFSAARSSQSADLQQSQPRRYTDPHSRIDIDDASAEQSRRPRGHDARAKKSRSFPASVW